MKVFEVQRVSVGSQNRSPEALSEEANDFEGTKERLRAEKARRRRARGNTISKSERCYFHDANRAI
jgi:hypothetical protein